MEKAVKKPTTAHVLMVPSPGQGHVLPFMTLSHRLVDCGVKVTFVIAKHIQTQIEAAVTEKGGHEEHNRLRIVWLPDGMEPGDGQKYPLKIINILPNVMGGHIEELIREFNESEAGEEKITYVIGDPFMSWVLEIAEKMGIKCAAFVPWAVHVFAMSLQYPKLIEDGILDENGSPIKIEEQSSPSTPMINNAKISWQNPNDPTMQKFTFGLLKLAFQSVKKASWIICNSIYELEPTSCDMIPGILPIGPLLQENQHGQPVGNFWQEDLTCLSWLDEQPICSVVYVSFGSVAIFSQQQFDEIALGIELLNHPFLWVV